MSVNSSPSGAPNAWQSIASPQRSCLVVAVVLYPKYILGHDNVYGFVPKFDLDGEINVPTWFSSTLLLLAGLLLLYIGAISRHERDRWSTHWLVLGCVFVLLSADETAGLHGLLSAPLRGAFHLSGAFYHAWVLPLGAAVAGLGAMYLRFLWSLPQKTRRLILVSGVTYVVGAIGFELPEGMYRTAWRQAVARFLTVCETCGWSDGSIHLRAHEFVAQRWWRWIKLA